MIKEIHQAIKRPNKFQDASIQTGDISGGFHFFTTMNNLLSLDIAYPHVIQSNQNIFCPVFEFLPKYISIRLLFKVGCLLLFYIILVQRF